MPDINKLLLSITYDDTPTQAPAKCKDFRHCSIADGKSHSATGQQKLLLSNVLHANMNA